MSWGLAIVVGTLWRIYIAIWEPRALTLNRPIRVETDAVFVGGQLTYTLDYCKSSRFRDEYSEIHYSFLNSTIYPAASVAVHSLPTGCNVVHETVTIPEIPDGEYSLEMERIYLSFSVNRFVVQSTSQRFRVTHR